MADVFDLLFKSSSIKDPDCLSPVDKVDWKWDLSKRAMWEGTQLANAWVQDRSTLLAAWGMAIALTQPFFSQDPRHPAEARPCLMNVPSSANVSQGIGLFGGTMYEQITLLTIHFLRDPQFPEPI
eukprot:1874295-Heterocapsa_arctica.AAC.1